MTAEDAYIAMGCPGNEAAATKQNIRKKARAMVAEARAEAGEPAAQSAKRGSAAPAKPAASKRAVPRIRIGVSEELSAYEKERQANIAQNNEQLVLLGLR